MYDHRHETFIARICVLFVAGLVLGLLLHGGQTSANNPPEHLKDQPLTAAAFTFPVQDVKLISDNAVSFTVPHDAREYNRKADAVVLSGLYATDQVRARACPTVDSHYVVKKVQSYNPFSGKADIVATFDNPTDAAHAAESGCLLIHDVD